MSATTTTNSLLRTPTTHPLFFVRLIAPPRTNIRNRLTLRRSFTSTPITRKMATDDACIFCKIIKGDIPSFKLAESDKLLAFLDIQPLSKGHAVRFLPQLLPQKLRDILLLLLHHCRYCCPPSFVHPSIHPYKPGRTGLSRTYTIKTRLLLANTLLRDTRSSSSRNTTPAP